MNIKEFDMIMSCTSLKLIIGWLDKNKFRDASPDDIWEVKYSVFNEKKLIKVISYDNSTSKISYEARIYTGVKGYGDAIFIILIVARIYEEDMKKIHIPAKMLLYTNAPINEEYERKQATMTPCNICKKEYLRKELVEEYDQLLCKDCFLELLKEEAKLVKEEDLP